MKTILLFKDNEILPNAGGIARMNYSLRIALEKYDYRIIYLAAKKTTCVPSETIQYYLPDQSILSSEDNILFIIELIKNESVEVIINNWFSIEAIKLLGAIKKVNDVNIISWIHNNTVEYTSLFGYRKERFLKKYHLYFLYKILTSHLTIQMLRYYGRYKYNNIAKELYEISNRVVTVCEGNAREFKFLLNAPDFHNKIRVISNFISNRTKDPIEEKEKIVVWCGAVNFELKKTNWMLDIWKSVSKNHQDWTLNIMGDSKQLDEMQQYALTNNVPNVIFQGRVDPSSFYEKAAILCSTSITESFGLSIVEGMQMGVVPVAFASSPSIPEIIKDNGVLVKPYNKSLFAKKISELISSNEKRKYLLKKCVEASSQYEEASIINDWIQLIENL